MVSFATVILAIPFVSYDDGTGILAYAEVPYRQLRSIPAAGGRQVVVNVDGPLGIRVFIYDLANSGVIADLSDGIAAEGLYLAVSDYRIGYFGTPCYRAETIEKFRKRNVLSGCCWSGANALYSQTNGLAGTQGLRGSGKTIRQRSSGNADRIARFVERLPCASGVFFYADVFGSDRSGESGRPVQRDPYPSKPDNRASGARNATFRKLARIDAALFDAKEPIGSSDEESIP